VDQRLANSVNVDVDEGNDDNDSPGAANEYSMFVNVNESVLSNDYYSTETNIYKATAAIVQNDTVDDNNSGGAESFSSVTSVYKSSESDRARSSERSSFSSPNQVIADTRVSDQPSHLLNRKNNGHHYPPSHIPNVTNRANLATFPSKVTVHEFANQVHSFQPRFITRQVDDHIISRQIGSSCEKIRETTSDDCSSQSSSASFMNRANSQFHSQTLTFHVIIVKNPDLGFVIEGGVDQMHSNDASIFVSNVIDCGPASTALKIGDRLLRVDEIDLCNVTNETAKAILQSTGPTVSLLVSRTACYV
jgi:hypothetical protein